MKVLVADVIADKGIEMLNEAGFDVDVKTGLSEDELVGIIADYNGMIVRSGVKVTKKILDSAKNLKVIARAGVGVDNIDIGAATEHKVIVMNTPFGNITSAGEHTITLIMMLAKHILHGHLSMKKGEWERKKFKGVELAEKTLGIIGLGKVGQIVAKAGNGLSMNVIGYDPFVKAEEAANFGVKLAELDEVIKQSDFITIHVPLIPQTKYLIDKKQFDMMKDGVRIVNCARGGVMNETALYDALVSGKVAAAAIDVWEEEPPFDSKLLELDQVVATPHIAASTKEAQEKVGVHAAEQIIDMLKKNEIRNALNKV